MDWTNLIFFAPLLVVWIIAKISAKLRKKIIQLENQEGPLTYQEVIQYLGNPVCTNYCNIDIEGENQQGYLCTWISLYYSVDLLFDADWNYLGVDKEEVFKYFKI